MDEAQKSSGATASNSGLFGERTLRVPAYGATLAGMRIADPPTFEETVGAAAGRGV